MAEVTGFRGAKLQDEHGTTLGAVSDVIYDGTANEPTWLVVKPGLLRAEHYVPARGAYQTADRQVVVPFTADQVKSAPKAKGDHVLDNEVRTLLAKHYQLDN